MTTDALQSVETPAYAAAHVVTAFADPGDTTPQNEASLIIALDAMEIMSSAQFRTAAAAATRAERLATRYGRPDLVRRARLVRADAQLRLGETAAAGRMAHEVLSWANEHGDAYVRARAHQLLNQFFRHIGDLNDALAHAVQSVSQLPDDAPQAIRARHLAGLAVALDETGSHDEGMRRFRESLDIAFASGDNELTMMILNNMAYTAFEQQNEPEARRLTDRMRAILTEGAVPARAHYLDTIARIELMGGRYTEAEQTLRPVLDGSSELHTEGNSLAECLLTAAEAQRSRGDRAQAQATLHRAVEVAEQRGLASYRARVREAQAALFADQGRYREAYEEHRRFYTDSQALQSGQREARARALQAAFEIDEARRTSEIFRELAQRDPLTGLHNRRFVNERLPVLLREAAEQRTPLSAALLDLDHFKRINDTMSHEAGDAVLERVGAILADAATGPAAAARMGGEEFLLILPGIDTDEAMRRCEELQRAIRAEPWAQITGGLPVTASIGLTTVRDGACTQSALLSAADRNLYAAKRSGRDRVVADPR